MFGNTSHQARDHRLTPHKFESRAGVKEQSPAIKVLVCKRAYQLMCAYVDLCPQEILWTGTAIRLVEFACVPGEFLLIENVFLPEQKVSSVEAKMDLQEVSKYINEFARQYGFVEVQKLKLFAHSHVRMSTAPSHIDEENLELQFCGKPWVLRLICNKLGRAEFTVCLREGEVVTKVMDAPWAIVDEGKELDTTQISADSSEWHQIYKDVAAQIHERVKLRSGPSN